MDEYREKLQTKEEMKRFNTLPKVDIWQFLCFGLKKVKNKSYISKEKSVLFVFCFFICARV